MTNRPPLRHEERHALAVKLLEKIKEHNAEIDSLYALFQRLEPEIVYRFYHQSFKVYTATSLIKQARELFERLSPDAQPLNSWYLHIADTAISKKFDSAKSNQIWLEETRPIVEAFWHSKHFLQHMIESADELETAPQLLPYGWAGVLYLYDLR